MGQKSEGSDEKRFGGWRWHLLLLGLAGVATAVTALVSAFETDPPAAPDFSSAAPAGATFGDAYWHCLGCGDAKDGVTVSQAWCTWDGERVSVHVVVENSFVTPVRVRVAPAYTIENGGLHGVSFGSDGEVPVDPESYTEAAVDAGVPKAIPTETPIAVCEPRVLSAYIEESDRVGELVSSGAIERKVMILRHGRLE